MILDTAGRAWIGTPFIAGQSVRGIGCDCVGFVAGVWRDAFGDLPEAIGPYAQDEPGRREAETLLDPLRRHLQEIDLENRARGDVLAWRWRGGRFAQHLAIASADGMIHADQRFGVVETPIFPTHRLAGVFRPWPL